MTVSTPTCKLCGFATSSTDVTVFGPELMAHMQVHPEAWEELKSIIAPDNQDGQHRIEENE